MIDFCPLGYRVEPVDTSGWGLRGAFMASEAYPCCAESQTQIQMSCSVQDGMLNGVFPTQAIISLALVLLQSPPLVQDINRLEEKTWRAR